MGLRELIERMRGSEPREEVDDDITTDRVLKSLRRERRVQQEFHEKEMLKKAIALEKKRRLREDMFGIKNTISKKKKVIGNILKEKVQKEKNMFLR